jgi:hypothetical protein
VEYVGGDTRAKRLRAIEVGLEDARTTLDAAEERRVLEASKGITDRRIEDAPARGLQ